MRGGNVIQLDGLTNGFGQSRENVATPKLIGDIPEADPNLQIAAEGDHPSPASIAEGGSSSYQ